MNNIINAEIDPMNSHYFNELYIDDRKQIVRFRYTKGICTDVEFLNRPCKMWGSFRNQVPIVDIFINKDYKKCKDTILEMTFLKPLSYKRFHLMEKIGTL